MTLESTSRCYHSNCLKQVAHSSSFAAVLLHRMPARPRDSRVGGFQQVLVSRRLPKRNSSLLTRSVALSAAEVQKLFRIDRASRVLLLLCLSRPRKDSFKLFVAMLCRLRYLRQAMCGPAMMTRTILQPKNRTIESIEWADDFVREFFLFNDRAQLRAALVSLRAPISLKLPGPDTGHVTTEFAFLLYVYKMSTGAKLSLMSTVFGEDYSVISRALAAFGAWLFDAHSHRLTDALHFWSQYANAFNSKIVARGLPAEYHRVWGFIDATLVCTGRPSDVAVVSYPPQAPPVIWDVDAQYKFYCAYAMKHGLKWQAAVGPCGLIMDMTGCAFGSHHDSRLLTDSKILQRLIEMHWMDLGIMAGDRYFQLMGDSAYSTSPVIIRVPGGRSEASVRCSSVRVAVEHAFSKIYQKCRAMEWSSNLRLFSGQRIIEMFYNCALLCNMHTCLNGSQIGNYFNCACPSLDDYMSFARRQF